MSKEIGPKERQLREQREARFAEEEKRRKADKPSTAELRDKVAQIKPKPKKAKKAKR